MKLRCLVGPTAAGKTRMAVEVAKELDIGLEVVSCDSMGIYRGLDIVADKPSAAEQGGVPHHLFDVLDPDASLTAVRFKAMARDAIGDVASRGGIPALVGGSGLYYRAVVDELAFAPTSPQVRERLEREDPDALLERLRQADPTSADRLDARNVRRIVRAVEILELTGRPPSELRTSWEHGGGPYELVVTGLTWSRDELMARVERRVERQFDRGLVDEVRRVRALGLSRTAEQALGVKEAAAHLDGGCTIEEARRRLKANTKRFVRRQLSWFRADPRVDWLNVSELGWDGAREAVAARWAAAA